MQQENDGPVMPQTGPQPVFAVPTESSADLPVMRLPVEAEGESGVGGQLVAESGQAVNGSGSGEFFAAPVESSGFGKPVAPAPGVFPHVASQEAAAPSEGAAELGSLDEGPGVAQYAGVDMSGPGHPPKPGTPSSGNWRMPEWMHEETEANRAAGSQGGGFDETEMKRDRSRTALFAGVGVLGIALIGGLGFFVLKGGDGEGTDAKVKPTTAKTAPEVVPGEQEKITVPPDKALAKFKGAGSPISGTVTDPMSGLSYPQFGQGWVLPTKKNKLGQSGWSAQQILVTEHKGTQYWYGTVLSAPLGPVERRVVQGDIKETAAAVSASLENRLYIFQHNTKPIASQALTVSGKKGWLIANYLTYKRPTIKATGELVVTVVVDTGKEVPSVLFMSIPNTHKALYPDVNKVLAQLKVS